MIVDHQAVKLQPVDIATVIVQKILVLQMQAKMEVHTAMSIAMVLTPDLQALLVPLDQLVLHKVASLQEEAITVQDLVAQAHPVQQKVQPLNKKFYMSTQMLRLLKTQPERLKLNQMPT